MVAALNQPISHTAWREKPTSQELLQPPWANTRIHLNKHTNGLIRIFPTTALASERERRVIPGRTPRWMIWRMPQLLEAVLLALFKAVRPLPMSTVIVLKISGGPPSASNQTDFNNQSGNLKNFVLIQVTLTLHNRRKRSFYSISRAMFTSRLQRNTINSKVRHPGVDHLKPSRTVP